MEKLQHNKIYNWSAIVQYELPFKRFIKQDGKIGLEFLASKNFHEQTYVEGFTFELIEGTSKFKVFENDFSKAKVWRFTTIRNIEWEINRVENYIWTLKFEFKSKDEIDKEVTRLNVLRDRLLQVLRGGVVC